MKIIFWAKKRRKKIDFHPQTLSLPIICRTRGRLDGNSDEESVKLWTSFFGLCEWARERERRTHTMAIDFFSVCFSRMWSESGKHIFYGLSGPNAALFSLSIPPPLSHSCDFLRLCHRTCSISLNFSRFFSALKIIFNPSKNLKNLPRIFLQQQQPYAKRRVIKHISQQLTTSPLSSHILCVYL